VTIFKPHEHKLLSEFINNGIDFLVIGGGAVVLHGHERPRPDLDLLLSQDDANLERLAYVDLTWLRFKRKLIDDFKKPNARIEHLHVEILTVITGVSAGEAFATKILVSADGLDIPVLSRELLVANKKVVGREKDLEDIEALSKRTP
jgi:hypothetical protein